MTKYSVDDFKESRLKMLCEEAAELEWINRAISNQLNKNANRLAEIDKELAKYIDHK